LHEKVFTHCQRRIADNSRGNRYSIAYGQEEDNYKHKQNLPLSQVQQGV